MTQNISARWIAIASALVLVVGGAYAGKQWMSEGPADGSGKQLRDIQKVYDRLDEEPAAVSQTPPPLQLIVRTEAPPEPAVTPPPAPPAPAEALGPPPPPPDPTADLAVQAITGADGELTAWLLKLSDRTTAEAKVGEYAFGLEVGAVSSDGVVLVSNGQSYDLRLDQKYIPPIAPMTVASAGGQFAFRGRGQQGQGRGQQGRGGQFGQQGRGGQFAQNNRGGQFGQQGRGGNNGNFNRANFDRSDNGNRDNGTRNNRNQNQRFASNRGGGFGGGNRGGGAAFGVAARVGGLAQNAQRGQQRALSSYQTQRATMGGGAGGSTYNAQEARRTGARYVGDGASTVTVNPQTARRTGQASGGGLAGGGLGGGATGAASAFGGGGGR